MTTGLVARASTTVDAPLAKVWDAFVNPDTIKRYMFGTTVVSAWKKGSPIAWSGRWKGRSYKDKGVILEIEAERRLRYTHYSPLAGVPDAPESYHTITVDLSLDAGGRVHVALTQDNNPTPQAREHSERNWAGMLSGLKKLLEA